MRTYMMDKNLCRDVYTNRSVGTTKYNIIINYNIMLIDVQFISASNFPSVVLE